MSDFTFPKPGELGNFASIPVAEHTLAALWALAEVGRRHLTLAAGETFVTPQMQEAHHEVAIALSAESYAAAMAEATRAEQELDEEYLF